MKKSQIWDPYADLEKTVLPNGLTIYSTCWNRPWMHVRVCVHSGALQDPKGKAGLAHFVEHMASERSGKLSDKNISKYIKNSGGRANLGSTNAYQTSYHFEMPLCGNFLQHCFDIFGKMLLLPFEKKQLERERKVILQEFKRYFPLRVKHEILILPYENVYCGTRFEGYLNPLGTPETIGAITMDDVVEFAAKHYNPSNISIVAAGGLEHVKLVEIIKGTFFDQSKKGYSDKLVKPLAAIPYPDNNERIIYMAEIFPGMKFDVSSIELFAMIPGTISPKAISMLVLILRDILFEQLRTKSGSTYRSEVMWDFLGDAYVIHATLFLDKKKLDEIKDSIVTKSLLIARNKKRFEQQKNFSMKSFIINDINMNSFCEEVLDDLVKFKRIINYHEEMRAIELLSYEEYCLLIDYLSDNRRWWNLIEIP